MSTKDLTSLKKEIKSYALENGFDIIGFTSPKLSPKYLKAFQDWLDNKYQGKMSYMAKLDQRVDLEKILPGVKTVISLAVNYYHPQEEVEELALGEGKVARYAYGRDYHKIIRKNLKRVASKISELAPNENTKVYVDTGPILERAFAEQAGVGVIGKNSCLITEKYGSWVFLAEILTTIDFEKDQRKHQLPKDFSACGACRRCIDACPTGAIISPGVIDSRRCLSYLTIELKDEEIPEEFRDKIKETKRIYGCDICQEVCPHNSKKQKTSSHTSFFEPKIAGNTLSKSEIDLIDTDQKFLERFAGSAVMRAKRKGLSRNFKGF